MPLDRSASGTNRHRALGVITDEALSSLQNFVAVFAALRLLGIADLGYFTLAYIALQLALVVLRSTILDPLTIRFSTSPALIRREAGRRALGASILVGTGWLALCVIVAMFSALMGSSAWTILLAIGLALPVVCTQTAWRIYFFASFRPWKAAANDFVCLIATLVGVLIVVGALRVTPATLLLALIIGAVPGVIFGAIQERLIPAPRMGWQWLRDHWRLGGALGFATVIEQGAGRISFGLVGIIAGSAALGTLSGSRTLVSPWTTLITASMSFTLPELARRVHGNRSFRFWLAAMSAVVSAVVLGLSMSLYLLPDSIGGAIAGANWHYARTLLLPAALWAAAVAAGFGARVGLRSMVRGGAIIRVSILAAVFATSAIAVGAARDGAEGAAWFSAVADFMIASVWWTVFLRLTVRDRNREPPLTPRDASVSSR